MITGKRTALCLIGHCTILCILWVQGRRDAARGRIVIRPYKKRTEKTCHCEEGHSPDVAIPQGLRHNRVGVTELFLVNPGIL